MLGLLRGCSNYSYGDYAYKVDTDYSGEPDTDSYTLNLGLAHYPNVLFVTAENVKNVSMRDMYGRHQSMCEHGIFGDPVEVKGDDFKDAVLTFKYDKDNMKLVPPKNLLVVHYAEGGYRETLEGTLDEKNCTVSLEIESGGIYMLVDRYEFMWSLEDDVSEYAHSLEYVFEGGRDFGNFPGVYAVSPIGTIPICIWDDHEDIDPETGLAYRTFFQSRSGSEIRIYSGVTRGDNAWDNALSDYEYMKSSPVIDDTFSYTYLGELVNEKDRIIYETEYTLDGRKFYQVGGYYYVDTQRYVSIGAEVPAASDESAKERAREFMQSLKFWDAGTNDDVQIDDE